MKGHKFDGQIYEGDEVEVVPGRRHTGGLVDVKEVYNRTQNATVRARELAGMHVLRIASVLTLLFIAIIMYWIFSSSCNSEVVYWQLPGPVQSVCNALYW
jgi:hypothetical protein